MFMKYLIQFVAVLISLVLFLGGLAEKDQRPIFFATSISALAIAAMLGVLTHTF